MDRSKVSQALLLKRQGLLESLAALIYIDSAPEFAVVGMHFQVLKAGNALTSQVTRLETLGDEPDERCRKDKKRIILTGVLSAATSFVTAVNSLKQHCNQALQGVEQETTQPKETGQEQAEDVDLANAADELVQFQTRDAETTAAATGKINYKTRFEEAKAELFVLDPVTTYEALLSSTVVLDAMSSHVVLQMEPLLRATKDLSPTVAKVGPKNSWKAGLGADHSEADVLQRGVQTLLKIETKGIALKTMVEKLHEDWLKTDLDSDT